jgi:hypothetical protein
MGFFNNLGTTKFSFFPSIRQRRPAWRPQLETMESRALLSGMPMHLQVPMIVHAEVATKAVHPLVLINLHNRTIQGDLEAHTPAIQKKLIGPHEFTYTMSLSHATISGFAGTLFGTLEFKGAGPPAVQNVTEIVRGSFSYVEAAVHGRAQSLDFSLRKHQLSPNTPFGQQIFEFTLPTRKGRFILDGTDPEGKTHTPGFIRFPMLMPAAPSPLVPITAANHAMFTLTIV